MSVSRFAPARRLFFALWPTEEERQALAEATHKAAAGSGGRQVPPESLHATLAFLGSVPEARLGDIARQVATEFAGAARPPPLSFAAFAHWSKARVLVALSPDEPRAQSLAARLKDLAAAEGFRPDLKPFHAHVTVARKVVHAGAAAQSLGPVRWRCDGFALIDSRTESQGSIYSVVESWTLVSAAKARE